LKYNQPLDQPTNTNAPYIDGNPAAGIQGSIVPAASIEYDQREIVEVINAANLRLYTDFTGTPCAVPSNSDQTQLRKAIEGYIQSWVIDRVVTFKVHGPGADFPDLIAAMDYLSKFRITNNGFVTLAVAGATSGVATRWTYNRIITFEHPNLDRISVQGAPMIGPPVLGTDFQYTGNRGQDAAAQLTMLRGRFATELYFTSGAYININGSIGFGGAPNPAGSGMANLLISSDGSTQSGGLQINNAYTALGNVSVQNTWLGIISNNSYFWTELDFVSSCGNILWGFEFQGCMALGATQTIACSNQHQGWVIQVGSAIRQGGNFIVYARGNADSGITCLAGGSASVVGSQFLNNGNWGILNYQGQISCNNSNFSGNVGGPMYATGGGIVATGSAGTAGCVPAANTQGNGFAFITV
jgi:hypothetical protein